MSVHYKFKAALDYSTVTFDGIHITVADLKKQIIEQKRLAKNADFDLQIINAQTKEIYEDESALIPKNTSVIVARIPFTDKKKNSNAGTSNLSANPSLQHKNAHYRTLPLNAQNTTSKSVDLTSMDGTEEDKIKAMMSQSTADYDPSRYVRIRGASQHGRVPDSYRCFKCNHAGHWIKHCPLLQSENNEVKKSTGIPRSFMVVVDGPDVPGALITPEGRYAVPAVDHAAYLEKGKQQIIEAPIPKPKIPDELLCNLCQDLLTDALLVPCCANSYCDDCIRSALLESEEQECPGCHEKEISPNTLIPNRFLRQTVNSFKNETGYSKPVKVVGRGPRTELVGESPSADARKLSLDELPDDLFPHSPRKIDTDAEDNDGNCKNLSTENDKTDLYDFNEGSIPSPFASPRRNRQKNANEFDSEKEQAIRTIGNVNYENPVLKESNRQAKSSQPSDRSLPVPQHHRNKPSHLAPPHSSGRPNSPGYNEVFPPGEEQMLNKDKLGHSHHHDSNEQSNMHQRTAPGLLPLPGIPPFNPRQPPPGFNASGPPPRLPPPNMFPGPPGVGNNGPPGPPGVNPGMNVNPNFPPFPPNFRMPPNSSGGPPPPFNQGGQGHPRAYNRGRSPHDMERYPNRDKMRRPLSRDVMQRDDRERPLEPRGAIDDPLKEFERIMREKDRRKKKSAMVKRSRSRSFSPIPRRSPSPFPKRSRSRSYSRSPSPKRKRPIQIRRRKSYSRSHSRSPIRRIGRSRSRSRNRTASPLPNKRRSPRRAPPFSPSPPMGRFPRKDKDDYRKEKDDYMRKEKDDYLRKDKDDYGRKEKDDYLRKEKDDYIRKDKDEYLRKDKDDYLRKDKDDYLRKDKDDYIRKDKDDYLRKDKDEYLRKEKDDYLRKEKDDYLRKDKDDYLRKEKDDYMRKDKDEYLIRKDKDDYGRKEKDDYSRKEKEEYFDNRPRYDDRPMRYGGKHYNREYDPKFDMNIKCDISKYENPMQSKFDSQRGHKFEHMGRPMGRGYHGNSQHHISPQAHYMDHEREKPMMDNFNLRPYDFDPNIAPPGTEPVTVPSLLEINIPPPRQHTTPHVYNIQSLANPTPQEIPYFKEIIKPKGTTEKELELDSVSMTPESEHEKDSKELRRHRKRSTESRTDDKKIKKDKKKHKKKSRDEKEKKNKKKKSKGAKAEEAEEEKDGAVSQSLVINKEEELVTAKVETDVGHSPSVESRQTVPDSTVKSPERVRENDAHNVSNISVVNSVQPEAKDVDKIVKSDSIKDFRGESTYLESFKPSSDFAPAVHDFPLENVNPAFKIPELPNDAEPMAVHVPTSKWDEYEDVEPTHFSEPMDVEPPAVLAAKEDSAGDKEIVTSEVLKRAENAIFEKTIGVLSVPPRVSESKKTVPIDYQRKKDVSDKYRSKPEMESLVPKVAEAEDINEESGLSASKASCRPSPVHSSVSKRSVKERLGSKLTDDEVSRAREENDDKVHLRSQVSSNRDASARDRDRRRRRSRSPERKSMPYRPPQRQFRRSPRRSRERSRPRRRSASRGRQHSRSRSRERRKSRSPRRYSPSANYRRRPRSRTRSPRSNRNITVRQPASNPLRNDIEETREPSPPGVSNKPLLIEQSRKVTVEKIEPENSWKLSEKFVPIGLAETSFTPSPPPTNLRIRTENTEVTLNSPSVLPFRKQRGRINIKLSSSSKAEERSSSSSTDDGDAEAKSLKKPSSVDKESAEDLKDDKKKRKEKKEKKKTKRRSKSASSSSSDDAKHKKVKRKKKKKNKKKKSK